MYNENIGDPPESPSPASRRQVGLSQEPTESLPHRKLNYLSQRFAWIIVLNECSIDICLTWINSCMAFVTKGQCTMKKFSDNLLKGHACNSFFHSEVSNNTMIPTVDSRSCFQHPVCNKLTQYCALIRIVTDIRSAKLEGSSSYTKRSALDLCCPPQVTNKMIVACIAMA